MTNPAEKKNTILLVDDEPGIRNVLNITLGSSGNEICLASDGKTGWDVFIEKRPGIVVTDIKMPGMDGIELLKRVKQASPETEVIMITGHGDMDLAVKSLQYGATDFITKPIDSPLLETAIQKAQDRIAVSENIRHYLDDLETLVKQKTRKIEESRGLLTIGQAIAGMSHAIKNIAGGLKGGSFVLEQGIEQENREYLAKGWEMMKGNIDKITQLSLDLLNYARTTRLEFHPENPNTPAREVVQLMIHRARKEKIRFKLFPAREKILMEMDGPAIHTCLLNLVTNAFDAFKTDPDNLPGKPGQTGPDRQIDLRVRVDTDQVFYSVRDNGCGMDDVTRAAVFNDFISTKGFNGTGFGLMTTQKIVREHGGTIEFTTRKNSGSEFIVQIPLKNRS